MTQFKCPFKEELFVCYRALDCAVGQVETVLDWAQQAGLKTGIVTNSR